MLRKLLTMLMVACLTLGVITGCDDEELDGAGTNRSGEDQGLSMRVRSSSGEMTIERPSPGGTLPDTSDEPAWTIFVYLCATDLESEDGMATADLTEMVAAQGSDDVRLVVETGGCKRWQGGMVKGTGLQRFVIQDGSINEVGKAAKANMGESQTLADFLTWGVANYPSEHMGVILWDHGGGSIQGVCFDEKHDFDALTLREVDTALLSTFATMGDKFDFIGFDACLMATIETANVVASYADYLYGSEEMEPGTGWDYGALVEYLADNPTADGAALGASVCKSYQAACKGDEDEAIVTFSVVDLSRMDDLLISFNSYADELFQATADANTRGKVARAIKKVDNYGGNNRSEGYTNMVDLGGVIEAGAKYAESADGALAALDSAVVTHAEGKTHADASGLSVYYPLQVEEADELQVFEDVCVSPYYLSFVDRTEQMGAGVDADDYDDSTWFDVLGEWLWGTDYGYDDESGYYSYEEEDDDYWSFFDELFEEEGESPYITFAEEPQVGEDGIFWFQLDEDGIDNAAGVCAYVYELSSDGQDWIELGETLDVEGDWDTGVFEDCFDGYWLSLPDGQNLATYIADTTDDYVVYTSPIELNGVETNLRMRQYFDSGKVVVEGTWDGISESGAAAREVVKLHKGDKIVPMYYSYGVIDDEENIYYGDKYKVRGKTDVSYSPLEGEEYDYCFCIDDVYGGCLMTDYQTFYVDDDGTVSFA